MECVEKTENWELWEYKPRICKPFFINFERFTMRSRVRFLIDYFYGYEVFYYKYQDEFIGYCTLTKGSNRRYWFANGDDIIIGPYYISEKCRGNGFCKSMVQASLIATKMNWKDAYIYTKNTNVPSIKVALSIHAEYVFSVHNTSLRRLVKDVNGEFSVYKVSRKRMISIP